MPKKIAPQKVLDAVRNAPGNRVKVAVSDIDGVLRGKYLHKDKFFSAVEGGFGFCDVVFGWDMNDQCYDNATLTGWHKGFPDAVARIDLSTYRNVPWDDDVPFFLGEFIAQKNGKEVPLSICPRQLLKRVLKRALATPGAMLVAGLPTSTVVNCSDVGWKCVLPLSIGSRTSASISADSRWIALSSRSG